MMEVYNELSDLREGNDNRGSGYEAWGGPHPVSQKDRGL